MTESAYTFSLGSDFVCGYSSDTFEDESVKLGRDIATEKAIEIAKGSEKTIETAKVTEKGIKMAKGFNLISKFNPDVLIISAAVSVPCYFGSDKEKKAFKKIAGGTEYIELLKTGYAYNGIVKEFQNNNIDTIQSINDATNDIFVKLHAGIQAISLSKTNKDILNEKNTQISNNNAQLFQLSDQNYENKAELAIGRVNDKTEESNVFMDNATYEFNELNNQIPYQIPFIPMSSEIIEKILNFIEEPEINYTLVRLKRDNASYLLNNARENHTMYKFNSAIQSSKDSIAQSEEGIRLANIEISKQRHLKI